jgi:hypothetical protein
MHPKIGTVVGADCSKDRNCGRLTVPKIGTNRSKHRTCLWVVPRRSHPFRRPMLRLLAKFLLWGLCRLRSIMSTSIACKSLINKAITKVGNYYLLGKSYLPKNGYFIPFCLKKTGLYPIYRPFLRHISHFHKGRLRMPTVILEVLDG